MASNGFNVRRPRGPVAPPPAHLSTDYDPLPPPPPLRPASAVGWAYDEPKGSAALAAPKARALPVMVEEDADSEVAAVTARLASAPLPPSAALAAAGRVAAAAPPAQPAPAQKAAKANVSYAFLVPPAPATSADAPGGASEETRKAALDAKYAARAAENEHLYGDRACAALPTRAVRRGCLNPIVDCVAPTQRGGGGGMRDDEDEDEVSGAGARARGGGSHSSSANQGGIVASVANSLSNLASYFGVGASDDDPYAAEEEEAAAAAAAESARRAAAKPVGGGVTVGAPALPGGGGRGGSAAGSAEESASAFEAAWRERQRLREAGATRLEADAAVTGLDPVAMAAMSPSPPPQQQAAARTPTPPLPQPSRSPDRMAAAGFAPQVAPPAHQAAGFDPAASLAAASAAAVAAAAEAAPPPPPTAPVPSKSASDMFNAPMRSRLKSGSAAAAAAAMDAEMARRMSAGGGAN